VIFTTSRASSGRRTRTYVTRKRHPGQLWAGCLIFASTISIANPHFQHVCTGFSRQARSSTLNSAAATVCSDEYLLNPQTIGTLSSWPLESQLRASEPETSVFAESVPTSCQWSCHWLLVAISRRALISCTICHSLPPPPVASTNERTPPPTKRSENSGNICYSRSIFVVKSPQNAGCISTTKCG
jgi:hypothetical protein